MKVISIANAKGGVAKTTTCLCLASYLASKGYNVLVMDLDSQANTTTTLLKMGVGEATDLPTLYDALFGYLMNKKKNKGILKEVISQVSENLSLIPASGELEGMKDFVKSKMDNSLTLIPTLLQSVKNDFDYVIVDCPPELSIYVRSTLYYSNLILMPSTYDKYAFDGVTQVIGTILDIFDEIDGGFPGQYRVVYTRVNPQATQIKSNLGKLESQMKSKGLILPFIIPVDQKVQTCQSVDGDLMQDAKYKNSRARLRYQDLGEYVIQELG